MRYYVYMYFCNDWSKGPPLLSFTSQLSGYKTLSELSLLYQYLSLKIETNIRYVLDISFYDQLGNSSYQKRISQAFHSSYMCTIPSLEFKDSCDCSITKLSVVSSNPDLYLLKYNSLVINTCIRTTSVAFGQLDLGQNLSFGILLHDTCLAFGKCQRYNIVASLFHYSSHCSGKALNLTNHDTHD